MSACSIGLTSTSVMSDSQHRTTNGGSGRTSLSPETYPLSMDSNNVQGRPDGEDGSIEVDTNVPNPNSSTVKIWSPARFLSTKLRDAQSGKPYAVIILNQPIDNKELLVDVCRGGKISLVQKPNT